MSRHRCQNARHHGAQGPHCGQAAREARPIDGNAVAAPLHDPVVVTIYESEYRALVESKTRLDIVERILASNPYPDRDTLRAICKGGRAPC